MKTGVSVLFFYKFDMIIPNFRVELTERRHKFWNLLTSR